jgi:hypothetical protein
MAAICRFGRGYQVGCGGTELERYRLRDQMRRPVRNDTIHEEKEYILWRPEISANLEDAEYTTNSDFAYYSFLLTFRRAPVSFLCGLRHRHQLHKWREVIHVDLPTIPRLQTCVTLDICTNVAALHWISLRLLQRKSGLANSITI